MNEVLSFNDIIKNSVVESSFLGTYSIKDIISVIIVAFIVSMYIVFHLQKDI